MNEQDGTSPTGPGAPLGRQDALLEGRRVLVTGAAQGIGQGVAVGLAALGAQVAILDLDESRLDETVSMIGDLDGSAVTVSADVSRRDEVDRAVAAAGAGMGGLDGVVNCAAVICQNGPAEEASEADLDRLWAINVKGSLFVSQAAHRLMHENGGAIVNLASQAALTALPHQVVYTATKGAVAAMTRSLAIDWAPVGIRVNAVAPTFVWTPMASPMLADPAVLRASERRIPLGRVGQPRDIAGAVAFLLSDAAAMVTGQILPVDGGWLAGEPGLDI